MFFVRALILLMPIAALEIAPIQTNNHVMPTDTTSIQSQELQSLAFERSSLKGQITKLEKKQDFWNRWYLVLTAAAVVGGLLSWLSQKQTSDKENQLRPLSTRVAAIDDLIQKIEQRRSDTAVAAAQKQASDAESHTQELARKNIQLKSALDKEVAESEKRAEELRKQNLATEDRLAEANRKLGTEEDKRLQLEKALSPRTLSLVFGNDGGINIARLLPFRTMQIAIDFIPDAEARRAARYVNSIVRNAGWTVTRLRPVDFDLHDGVSILSFTVRGMPSNADLADEKRSRDAAHILAEFLHTFNWAVDTIPGATFSGSHDFLPRDSILVQIGLKPDPR